MVRKITSFVTVLLVACSTLAAQEYYTVIAKSGLSLRAEPALDATKLGRLDFLEDVELIEKTDRGDLIDDEGKNVLGTWYKVKTEHGIKGYAFGAFLLRSFVPASDNQRGYCEQEDEPCQSTIAGDGFQLVIFDYAIDDWTNPGINGDTIIVYEYVFNDPTNKVVQCILESSIDSIQVGYTASETIRPVYNRWMKGSLNKRTEVFHWFGKEPYRALEFQGEFARLPIVSYYEQFESRKAQFSMRDTIMSSEGGVYCNLMLEDSPLFYSIPDVLLRIVPFKDGQALDPQFIKIVLSYGC